MFSHFAIILVCRHQLHYNILGVTICSISQAFPIWRRILCFTPRQLIIHITHMLHWKVIREFQNLLQILQIVSTAKMITIKRDGSTKSDSKVFDLYWSFNNKWIFNLILVFPQTFPYVFYPPTFGGVPPPPHVCQPPPSMLFQCTYRNAKSIIDSDSSDEEEINRPIVRKSSKWVRC